MLSRKRKVRADDRVGVGDDQLLQVGLGSRVGIVSDVCVQQEQGQEQLHQQQDVVAGVEVGGASGVGVQQQRRRVCGHPGVCALFFHEMDPAECVRES